MVVKAVVVIEDDFGIGCELKHCGRWMIVFAIMMRCSFVVFDQAIFTEFGGGILSAMNRRQLGLEKVALFHEQRNVGVLIC